MNIGFASGRLDSLTSLRFFAALFVVLLHVGQVIPPAVGFDQIFSLGYTGVTFFFILSGLVLTWTYRPGDKAGGFYGRRIARVWPLHLVTTILAACLLFSTAKSQNLLALPFVLSLSHAFVPAPDFYYAYNGPSWTLSCEAFFYLLFPLLIRLAARAVRPPLVIGTIIFLMCASTATVALMSPALGAATGYSMEAFTGYFLNIFPVYRLGEFAVGVLLGVMLRRGWRSPLTTAQALGVGIGTIVMLTVIGHVWFGGAVNLSLPIVGLVVLIPFTLIIGAAASSDAQGRRSALHAPWLVRLGEASFALYLVHHLVFKLVESTPVGLLPAPWVATCLAIVAAILGAELAHRWIERPAERLLRARIGRRLPDKASQPDREFSATR